MKKCLVTSLIWLPLLAWAQVLYPDTYLVDYYRLLDLQNEDFATNVLIYPSNIHRLDSLPEQNIWGSNIAFDLESEESFRVLPVHFSVNYNSTYARGYNDGAVWKGKGLNSDLNFGFRGNKGRLHYTFAPVVYAAQNQPFDLVDRGEPNPYTYQFIVLASTIDWTQRYGESSRMRFHPGQSEIRLIHRKMTLGLSTQNVILGPAKINPIMMSNNAAMFPHIDLGTNKPFKTPIGDLEFRSFWGIMSESEFFDDTTFNDRRYFQGGGIFLRPTFIEGITMGVTRIHYRDWGVQDFRFSELFLSFADFSANQDTLSNGMRVNDTYDQMAAANIRWRFPEVGFEAYMELARNDFSSVRTISIEPEHSRAYTLGFSKLFVLKSQNVWKGSFEHTVLGGGRLASFRGAPLYYAHPLSRGGYTERGQILGAGVGPGSTSTHGSIYYYSTKGMMGLDVQRIRFNDDFAFLFFVPNDPNRIRPFDLEYTFTAKFLRFLTQQIFIGGELSLSHRLNWNYIQNNDVLNLYGRVSLVYNMDGNFKKNDN